MFEKLKLVQEKYEEISKKLQEPDVINDNLVYRELMKEYKNLTPVVEKFNEYCKTNDLLKEADEILNESGNEKRT